jgi:hypothetical protein
VCDKPTHDQEKARGGNQDCWKALAHYRSR